MAVSVARGNRYLGLGFFNTVIWANITDVIDDQEVQTGTGMTELSMRYIRLPERSDRRWQEASEDGRCR